MMRLVAVADAVEHFDGVVDIRLFDEDWRETAIEGAVFLDVLAVFVHGRRADCLQLAAGQSWLHHVAGIHGAGGRARAHHLVQLVNEKDDFAIGALDFFDCAFQPLLKLAAEATASQHAAQIQAQDAFAQQQVRHVVGGDLLRQAFDDGGFADAGFAD